MAYDLYFDPPERLDAPQRASCRQTLWGLVVVLVLLHLALWAMV